MKSIGNTFIMKQPIESVVMFIFSNLGKLVLILTITSIKDENKKWTSVGLDG